MKGNTNLKKWTLDFLQTLFYFPFSSFWMIFLVGVFTSIIPQTIQAQQADLEIARQLATSHQYEAAEEKLVELLDAYPGYLPARLLRAHNHSWWHQYDLAIREFKAILEQYPEHQEALSGLGYAYAWSGDTANAIHPFQKLSKLASGSEEARKGLGYTYLIAGNGKGALWQFESLTKDFENNSAYFTGLGQAYVLLTQTKNAAKAFKKALALDPTNHIAQEFLDQLRIRSTLVELDVLGGYSRIGEMDRFGLRFLQASWQFEPRFSIYAQYDNSLSLDNIDFVNSQSGAPATMLGSLAAWNKHTTSRLAYGWRFFPERKAQHLVRMEQIFYLQRDFNIRLGGFVGMATDFPVEWNSYLGFYIPIGKWISVEPTYFYGEDGINQNVQHRALLAVKAKASKGLEVTLGTFYGIPKIEVEQELKNIKGAYLLALFPINKMLLGQVVVNREIGIFQKSTQVGLGIKLRLEK